MTRTKTKLRAAATTGNGTAYDCGSDGDFLGFYIVPTGTIAGGAVQFESSPTSDYAGIWAPLGSPVTVVDGTASYTPYEGPLMFVRARISTDVTGGGSITVWLVRT